MEETIFIFIYGYIPGTKYGGPVTSIYNFTECFGEKYDIRIVCSNHEHGSKEVYSNIKQGWNSVGKCQVMYLAEKEYKEKKFLEIMKEYSVKLVYLTGVFSYFLNHAAIKAAKKINAPVVIATRGEILKNILKMKSYKKIPFLWLMRISKEYKDVYFQVTSEEEHQQLMKYLNITDRRIFMLPNIHGSEMQKNRFEKKKGQVRILFISRIHPKKNLLDAVNAVVNINVNGNALFDIYGPVEDESYWEKCKEIIKKAPSNVRINYCGALDLEESKEIYCQYHVFLFPTLSENYGHVIAESIIANCPVIISKGTTPWDDIEGRGGYVVDLYDISALTSVIEEITSLNELEYGAIKKKLEIYKKQKFNLDELLNGYEKLIHIQK